MTFAEAIASAEAQYQQQRTAYVAALSPEQLEAIQRNASKPRPIGRRITIERERGGGGLSVAVSVCGDHQTDQGGEVTQQSIDQEIYRQRLIDYVKANSNKNEQQAIEYLDQNCPAWRHGVAPAAGVVEVAETGDQEQ